MAVTVTADDVRARTGATAAEWPDSRVTPVLAIATIRARAAQSDDGLTGDAAALWAAGVVALTWHMLTATSTGGGGQVKRVRDGILKPNSRPIRRVAAGLTRRIYSSRC